jgi:hypothetical protein
MSPIRSEGLGGLFPTGPRPPPNGERELMELGDFWMIRKMLHGLRERAEGGVAV